MILEPIDCAAKEVLWVVFLAKLVPGFVINFCTVLLAVAFLIFIPSTDFFKDQVKDLKRFGISLSMFNDPEPVNHRDLGSSSRFKN